MSRGGGLPLFAEAPRRGLLGNSVGLLGLLSFGADELIFTNYSLRISTRLRIRYRA